MCLVTTTHNNDNDSNNHSILHIVCTMISKREGTKKRIKVTNKEAMFCECSGKAIMENTICVSFIIQL